MVCCAVLQSIPLLPIVLGFAESMHVSRTCNDTQTCVGLTPISRQLPQSPIMLQVDMRSQAMLGRRANSNVVALELTDATVASHMRKFSTSPTNVAAVIQSGLQAILNAVVHFSAQPPRVAEGIVQLGEDLFECVEQLLLKEHKSTQQFMQLRDAWRGGFESLPGTVESITVDIDRFVRDGDAPALIRAVGSIINEAGMIVSSFLLPDIGGAVVKYLDAVDTAFITMGSSWDEFAQGKTVEAIEQIYWGLRSITDGLMPHALKNNTVYNIVISALDLVIGNLSTHVLEYERRIMEANVCWRTEKHRDRQRPMHCPPNYFWDGVGYCYPTVALLQSDSSSGQFDVAAQNKGGDSGGHYAVGHNAIPARCDMNGYFAEKHGTYCYTPCGAGFQQKAETHTRCISSCEGNFSAETPLMCGRDSGIITKAILEMVTTVLNSAFSLADNIIKMKEHGVDAETLTATIQVFIDMGKPFANPTCPVIEKPSTETSTDALMQCLLGQPLYITSHRGAQVQDNHGSIRFSSNKLDWAKWILSDAGDGKLYISSHRNYQLSDHSGQVSLSPNKEAWEKWAVLDAGDGKVFFRSHRLQHLKDHNGDCQLSWSALGWEKWSVTDLDGNQACNVATTTVAPTLEELLLTRASVVGREVARAASV